MQSAGDWAVERFNSGYNCAESALAAIARAKGVDVCTAPAVVFGGGIVRQGWVCGALTGALMALAFEADATDPATDGDKRTELMDRCQRLVQWFEQRAGSQLCRDIIGYVPAAEGPDRHKISGVKEKYCLGLVRDTVDFVLAGMPVQLTD